MEPLFFFNSIGHLEPKCPKCESKIEYDVTTEWDEKKNAHKCRKCGEILE